MIYSDLDTKELIKLMGTNPTNYLLIYKEINDRSFNDNNLDSNYLYRFITSEMLDIAWHLAIDVDWNMQNYQLNKNGISKLNFKKFDVYNNMQWQTIPEATIDDYYFEAEKDILTRYFDKLSETDILQRIENTLFRLLPTRIGLKPEFLDLEYNDIDTFGKWFESLNYDKDSFQSFVAIEIDEIANIFTNK